MRVLQVKGVLLGLVILGSMMGWSVNPAMAQEQPVRIILEDGSNLVGHILQETDETIRFRTVSGVEMTVPRAQIKKMEVLQGTLKEGKYVRYDPNRTRLFFAPTARSQHRGQGYIALYEILFPYVSVGIGDIVSVGGGITLFPASDQLLYGAGKVTLYERPTLALAAGAFVLTFTGASEVGGLLLGVGTFGPHNRSVTLGIGFGFGGGDFEETPALLVGGEYQVSNSIKLISENYIIPEVEDGILFAGGIRFFGERFATDFGLVTTVDLVRDADGFPFFPWLGFVYNFGKRRLPSS